MLTTTDTILGPEPPRSVYLEGFRVLRAHLLALQSREPFHSVMITSAAAREGKTTVSINLATVLAIAKKRTIVVDADPNQQGLSRALDLRGLPGLTDLCLGAASLQDVLRPTELEALKVVSVGTQAAAASELAIGPEMARAVHELSALADLVIFDATPTLGFGTALSMACAVDIVLIVARARGKAEPVQHAIGSLTELGAKVGGVIVNDIMPRDSIISKSYYNYYGIDETELRQ